MAIQYVGGRTQAIAGANSGTANVALTGLTGGSGSQPAAGDLVMVGYASGKTADQAISISGYSEVLELYRDGSGADANLEVASKFMGASPDTAVAVPNSGSTADAVGVSVRVYRGVDPANPFDVAAAQASGTGTTNADPAAITPATPGAALVAFGAGAVAGTGTTFASSDLAAFHTLNSPDNNDATIGAGHVLNWQSGAVNPAAFTAGTVAAGNSWAAVTLALRPLQTVTHQGGFVATGSGTIAAAGRKQLSAALAATGAGTFAAAATRRLAAAATWAGNGFVTAAARLSVRGGLAAAGTSIAGFAARVTVQASAAWSSVGQLVARGSRSTPGAATIAGSGSAKLEGQLTAAGGMEAAGSGAFTAAGETTNQAPTPARHRVSVGTGIGL